MRLQIVSKLRRAASALFRSMLLAWLILLIAAGALMLIVALIVATLAHAAFGWWSVAVVAAFVLAVIFGKDPPTEPTSPRRKRKGLHLNDDPNPWYMQSQYRFGSGNSAAHNRWHKRSEEHTSELQSLMRISYAVFCLKIKNNTIRDLKVKIGQVPQDSIVHEQRTK